MNSILITGSGDVASFYVQDIEISSGALKSVSFTDNLRGAATFDELALQVALHEVTKMTPRPVSTILAHDHPLGIHYRMFR